MPEAHPSAGAAAFLLEEFGPPVAVVSGQVENLIVAAGAQALDESLADLQRIREAIGRLHNLVEEVVVSLTRTEADAAAPRFRTTSELRHDLRAPLNAVKGYAELLIEEAEERGVSVLIAGLADVVDSAGQLLAKIDEFSRLLEQSDAGHGETAGDAASPSRLWRRSATRCALRMDKRRWWRASLGASWLSTIRRRTASSSPVACVIRAMRSPRRKPDWSRSNASRPKSST